MSFEFKRFARELTEDSKRVDRFITDPQRVLGEFGIKLSDRQAEALKSKLAKMGKARTTTILKEALFIIEPTW